MEIKIGNDLKKHKGKYACLIGKKLKCLVNDDCGFFELRIGDEPLIKNIIKWKGQYYVIFDYGGVINFEYPLEHFDYKSIVRDKNITDLLR